MRRGVLEARALPSLLYTTTRNLALNEKRRRGIRARLSIRVLLPRPAASLDPLFGAESSEAEAAAARAVDALPARRREIFRLARHHGLTHREIAEILEISPQTVANQMTAALEQLRVRLRPYLSD